MSQLALYLLGAPRVELDGQPLHIGRTKALALLAYLAVTATSHRRDALAALLWPEYNQSRARADLRRTLSLLNRRLGKGWLVADRETACINPYADVWLDVEQIRRRLAECSSHVHGPDVSAVCADCVVLLEETVGVYGDDFLSGFTLRDSLAFDEWQFFQTERLKGQLASALERLVRWYSEREQYDRAIAHARRLLEHDVLNDGAHRRLMELYALAGQQTAALRQFQLCEKVLAEELGLSPSEETRTLFERILIGEEIEPDRKVPLPPHNLPLQPTPFVGREAELAELDRLVADLEVRLITILGPGGIGKTRLALAAAEEQLKATVTAKGELTPLFQDGVWFVPLAGLSTADQIMPNVARALEFRLEGGEPESRTPEQQVLDYLREKRLLVILDNFEHLLEGVDLVSRILGTAPAVKVLVTSREQLPLREQQTYPIRGLAFPDWDALTPTEDYAAARLFIQAAHRIRPGFELAGNDAASLIRICRVLDGTPLGIELAAAWVDVLTLADIAAEIERNLEFLETEWQDVPSRHRSMRAVFDASWRGLDPFEQDAFVKLSVFRGGFTRAAAQQVAGADIRTLARLVEKSLIQFDRALNRYDVHELLRQYGKEKLAANHEREGAVRDRYSAFFCAALGQWGNDLVGPRDMEANEEIAVDWENVRAAWEEAIRQGHAARLDQAIYGLRAFIWTSGRFEEGEAMCRCAIKGLTESSTSLTADGRRVLAGALIWCSELNAEMAHLDVAWSLLRKSKALLEDPALVRCDTRAEKGALHMMMGWEALPDWEKARTHYEKALELQRDLGFEGEVAYRYLNIGMTYGGAGEYGTARKNFEESLARFRALGNHSGMIRVLEFLGHIARDIGDYENARRRYEAVLSLAIAKGYTLGSAYALHDLGALALFLGLFKTATIHLRDSIAIYRDLGVRATVAYHSSDLAAAYWLSGDFGSSCETMEEALSLSQRLGAPYPLAYSSAYFAWLDVVSGRYSDALTRARSALTLVSEAGIKFLALPTGLLGWVALAEERYAEAESQLQQSLAGFRAHADPEYEAWSLAALAGAEYVLGNRSAAQGHLLEALEIVVEIRAFIPLLHLMPIITLILAEEDDAPTKERAVELHALSTSHPFLAKAQLFEDIAWRQVRAATAALSQEVVTAARARGQALDWWETAEALMGELRDMGWSR